MAIRFRYNRGPMIPEGTTHVLHHMAPEERGGQGWWAIDTLADYLSGARSHGYPDLDGGTDLPEADLARFAIQSIRRPGFSPGVRLTRFEVEVEGCVEPACYVTPEW